MARKPDRPAERKITAGFNGSPKLTDELTTKIAARLKAGNFRETACASVGVSSRSLRKWLRQAVEDKAAGKTTRFTTLADALDEAEGDAEHIAVQMARKAGKEDWRFWCWWLEHKCNKRWGYKAEVRVTLERDRERMLELAERTLHPEQYERLLVELTADEAMNAGYSDESAEDPGAAGK
jgi:hypothetical protein